MSETIEKRIRRVATEDFSLGTIQCYASDAVELLDERDKRIAQLLDEAKRYRAMARALAKSIRCDIDWESDVDATFKEFYCETHGVLFRKAHGDYDKMPTQCPEVQAAIVKITTDVALPATDEQTSTALDLLREVDTRVTDLQYSYEDANGVSIGKRIHAALAALGETA